MSSQIQQPKGVVGVFTLQLLGMTGFSMIFSLCVLYCTKRMGFSDNSGYAITAAFNALAFALSVPGGVIAEKYLGYRLGTVLSLFLCGLGLLVFAIPTVSMLYLGLALFLVGTGMNLPCLFVLLGNLYQDQPSSQLRENGFLYAYIGMNVGSFIASALSGTLVSVAGYYLPFLVGAAATFLMYPVYLKNRHYFKESSDVPYARTGKVKGLFYVGVTILVTIALVRFAGFSDSLLVVFGFASILYALKLSFSQDRVSRNKLIVFILLTVLSIIFWTLYSLSPSALTLFIDRNVDRSLYGWTIPTADFSSLNPFFIITLGPIFAYFWSRLEKRSGFILSTPYKFAFGIALMGVGFLVLVLGIKHCSVVGLVSIGWIVLSYFLQTAGELFVGPVGYAMVGALVPKKKEGLMMGIWQLSAGISGALSDYLSRWISVSKTKHNPLLSNVHYAHSFEWYGLVTIAVGVFAFLISKKLNAIISERQAMSGASTSAFDDDMVIQAK
ncbi:MAG: hypothetical protein COV52_05235 [Gammaproteobacteria bacterium CG11_big_fil_rev_8_21_14_0_20_46_22]|nr:MAG: hypothetical protein COW05_10020 [Gammaproteobacteria bacterium CG12_big_fil_rev_8_21_14_0_65_46_12]PIR11200.1 MAG: hypothetical protein COV52_05235 [Gammaproteobacteria bacterium CG11_big_fil_rev_8_21_14_0_20_46_22]